MHAIHNVALVLACIATAAVRLQAQDPASRPTDPSTAELKERLAAKLEKPVFAKHPWHKTRAAALADAGTRRSMVLAYFTRSYAPCPPCEAFEERVLASDGFAAMSERVALYLHVASRLPDATDAGLPTKLGFRAVPTVALLAADGTLLHQVAYVDLIERPERVVARLLEIVGALEERDRITASLADKPAEAGDPRVLRVLFAELRLGAIDPDAAAKRIAAVRSSATPAEQVELEALLADVEVESLLARASTIGRNNLHEALARMATENRLPSDRMAPRFWFELLRRAGAARDVDLFRRGLDDLRRRFRDDPGFAPSLKLYEDQLAELTEGRDKGR